MNQKQKILTTEQKCYKVDLFIQKRSRNISFPRMVAMSMLHLFTNMTLEDISKEFGKADHARVIYSKKKVWELCKIYPDIRKQVIELETQLESQ